MIRSGTNFPSRSVASRVLNRGKGKLMWKPFHCAILCCSNEQAPALCIYTYLSTSDRASSAIFRMYRRRAKKQRVMEHSHKNEIVPSFFALSPSPPSHFALPYPPSLCFFFSPTKALSISRQDRERAASISWAHKYCAALAGWSCALLTLPPARMGGRRKRG